MNIHEMHKRRFASYPQWNIVVVGQTFWCGFNSRGPGALVKINSIMDSTKHQAILADNLVATTTRLRLGHRCTSQRDDSLVLWQQSLCSAMVISGAGPQSNWKAVGWPEEGSWYVRNRDRRNHAQTQGKFQKPKKKKKGPRSGGQRRSPGAVDGRRTGGPGAEDGRGTDGPEAGSLWQGRDQGWRRPGAGRDRGRPGEGRDRGRPGAGRDRRWLGTWGWTGASDRAGTSSQAWVIRENGAKQAPQGLAGLRTGTGDGAWTGTGDGAQMMHRLRVKFRRQMFNEEGRSRP